MDGYVYDDGGRKAAGFKGTTNDCVVRAVAIATEWRYTDVYRALNELAQAEKYRRGKIGRMAATGRGSSARTGVLKPTTREFLESIGWTWQPTMRIGQGCTVHLDARELPAGRLVVAVSKHLTAVIDGVIHDTHDPRRLREVPWTRLGKWECQSVPSRCVYGYWHK